MPHPTSNIGDCQFSNALTLPLFAQQTFATVLTSKIQWLINDYCPIAKGTDTLLTMAVSAGQRLGLQICPTVRSVDPCVDHGSRAERRPRGLPHHFLPVL